MVNIITELHLRSSATPDLKHLKRKKEVLLFVYDDHKYGNINHKYLTKHGKYLGKARSATESYSLKQLADNQCVALEEKTSVNYMKGYLVGEVYAVPPEFIVVFDQIMNNGLSHERTLKNFLLLDQGVGGVSFHRPFSRCHVYLGLEPFWDGMGLKYCPSYFMEARKQYGSRNRYYDFSPRKVPLDDIDLLDRTFGYGRSGDISPWGDNWD